MNSLYSKQSKTIRVEEGRLKRLEKEFKEEGDSWDDVIRKLIEDRRKLIVRYTDLYLETKAQNNEH